jgi:hypothetical protein
MVSKKVRENGKGKTENLIQEIGISQKLMDLESMCGLIKTDT